MTRRCFDSTTAADIPAGSELVMGYVDGSSRWSDADWLRFSDGRTLVRLCIFNDRYDAQVIDLEPGNNDARGAVPWIREKWLRGETPTVYCFSDRGPYGYRISDVRSECDAASLKHPLFIITDFDNDPTLPDDPEVIGKQYANSDLTGGHYDVTVVRDFWPGVDEEDTMTDDQIIAAIERKYDLTNTIAAIKEELTKDAHHIHAEPPNITGERIVVPFPTAAWFGANADLSIIGWNDKLDASLPTRYFTRDGVAIST